MGASSATVICNLALGWLGARRIPALLQDPAAGESVSKEQQLCSEQYPAARDMTLELGDWLFATRFTGLTLQDPPNPPIAPLEGGVYPLMPDTLRVIAVDDGSNTWRQVWERIDDRVFAERFQGERLYVRYIRRMVDVSKYSGLFVYTLAARLAADLAIPLTESTSRRDHYEKLFVDRLARSRAQEGAQGSNQQTRADRLRRARR